MTGPTDTKDLLVSFPAAGARGTTRDPLKDIAARRGMGYTAMANPVSVHALESGAWRARAVDGIGRAVQEVSAGRVVLVGHSMGGLSALHLYDDLRARLARPVGALLVNTPCPDASGRIPTMSRMSDAGIAGVLARDGFPPELLDDPEMLAEIADGLRADATVADRLAERVGPAGGPPTLHVLSARGDTFIPPERCAAWQHRVSREFHLTIANGGHALDEGLLEALDRAIDPVLASARKESA
ncbi:alpha/beta fold hydrolase [Streptomyces sp. NPDC050856]|uniref:thioesterase II family protein n=1 Tax=Streptomyces sp. NPDC050856 TaxID=3154939 RepID=UPI003407AD63